MAAAISTRQNEPKKVFQFSCPITSRHPIFQKIKKVVYYIFLVLFFPLALFQLGKYFLHRLVGRIILVSQYEDYKNEKIDLRGLRQSLVNVGGEEVYFKTEDGVELNGCYLPCIRSETNPSPKLLGTTLICLGGIGMKYECFADSRRYFLTHFRTLGCDILLLNYRGVVDSSGTVTKDGLINDVHAAYHFAVNYKNSDPKKIMVFGHSLGGGLASILGGLHPDIKALILDRTYSSLANAAANIAIFSFSRIVQFWVKIFLKSIGWQIDAVDSLRKTKAKICVLFHKKDEMIKGSGHLCVGLREKKIGNVAYIELKNASRDVIQHCRMLNGREIRQIEMAITDKSEWKEGEGRCDYTKLG